MASKGIGGDCKDKKDRKRVITALGLKKKASGFLLSWGLMTHQPLWVILCHLPEKGRKETEEIVEEKRRKGEKGK